MIDVLRSGSTGGPNAEQRRVVEAGIDLPQKVVAGAGTGKTMTMVWRFGHLVRTHGFDPRRIMAVTFTNKAAGELRERITRELLENGLIETTTDLDGAWIGTFHALAFRLLREHCYEIGFDRETTIIDELEAALLVQSVQRSLRDDEIVDAAILELEAISPDRAMKLSEEMFRLIQAVRGLGRSPDEVRELIARTVDHVRCRPKNVTDTWREECKAHREAAKLFNATYEEYGRRLEAEKLLDYDGVLIWARDALRDSAPFQRQIRELFQYIIVDEFQDTNRVQLELLASLAKPNGSNLEVVGDPRQSIYGWRDAAIRNILDFPGNVDRDAGERPRARSFDLVDNYRSDQTILDAAAVVLEKDRELYGSGRLMAVPERRNQDAFQLFMATSPEEEAEFIGSKLIELHASGRPWGDMAILTRAGSPPVAFETELRKRDIPYVTGRGQGFLDRQEIKDVLTYLRVINDPLDDEALIRMLQGPVARVADDEMYAVRQRTERERKQTTWDLLTDSEGEGFPELGDDSRRRVRDALHLVRDGMARKAGVALGELLQMVLEGSRYVALASRSEAEGQRRMANIRKLTRMAADFESRQVFTGLGDFIRYVELHYEMEIRTAEADVKGVDAVSFMTIHTAKGLEFPVVFLAHLRPFSGREAATLVFDDEYGLVLKYVDEAGDAPTHKYEDWRKNTETPKMLAEKEERRVVYVALTRAKDQLFVTATRRTQADWEAVIAASEERVNCNFDFFRQLAIFVEEDPGRGVLLPTGGPGSQDAAHTGMPLGEAPIEPCLPEMSGARGVTGAPRPLQLSPSALAAFQQCPLRYRYMYEWRLPGIPDGMWPVDGDVEAVERDRGVGADVLGTLVHELLQWAHGFDVFPGEEQVKAQWEQLAGGRVSGRDAEREWTERVAKMMEGYRDLDVAGYETLAIEKQFRLILEVDGQEVAIDGRVDRVCRSTVGEVLLLDYKTTRDINARVLESYRRQLAVYQLASKTVFEWAAEAFLVDLPRGKLIRSGAGERADEVSLYVREIVRAERNAPPDAPCYVCGYRLSCPSSKA
jgi:DNA helicase-2/ATP-dependent DNA helicase PcrA